VPPECLSQDYWGTLFHRHFRQTLVRGSPARDRVRLEFQQEGTCTGWLTASPAAALGNSFPASDFRLLLKWHLGIPILPDSCAGLACPACSAPVDIFGDHAVSCHKGSLWNRHFHVQDFLLQTANRSGVPCQREVSVADNSQERPADLFFPRWDGPRDLAVDITIRHPVPPSLYPVNPETAINHFSAAERSKDRHYTDMCDLAGADFCPALFSTWGSSSKRCDLFLGEFHRKVNLDRKNILARREVHDFRNCLSTRIGQMVAIQLEKLTEIRLNLDDIPPVGKVSSTWWASHPQPGVSQQASSDNPSTQTGPKRCRGTPGPQGRESVEPPQAVDISPSAGNPLAMTNHPETFPPSGTVAEASLITSEREEAPRRSSRLAPHRPQAGGRAMGTRPVRRRLAINDYVAAPAWYEDPDVDIQVVLEPTLLVGNRHTGRHPP
jgi:hypothetical protein